MSTTAETETIRTKVTREERLRAQEIVARQERTLAQQLRLLFREWLEREEQVS